MIKWTRDEYPGGYLRSATVEGLGQSELQQILSTLAAESDPSMGDVLQVHWCDGYLELSLEQQIPGTSSKRYAIDVREFWQAAELEDVDDMDRELSTLRDSAHSEIVRLTPGHFPWVRRISRYEDDVWDAPDELVEL